MDLPEREERKTQKIFETIMTEDFYKLHTKTTEPGNSENIKRDKCQKKHYTLVYYFQITVAKAVWYLQKNQQID